MITREITIRSREDPMFNVVKDFGKWTAEMQIQINECDHICDIRAQRSNLPNNYFTFILLNKTDECLSISTRQRIFLGIFIFW